ncbi:hypothetical protein GJ744_003899 [Endocarpon pusillum]|uniref:Heterokaryon incompatibility domain-containing protein n=1 Tax=Endocarpon pusillum TaxID=364733 RepID=A0A8H7AA99_9EURO|nr:hypothetical protein GJ744_003899 [Endocarpon pusillum]
MKKGLSARLCLDCTQLLSSDRSVTISELHSPAKDCALCKILHHVVLHYHSEGQKRIDIFRNGSALKIVEGGPRILRLFADLEPSINSRNDIETEPPILQAIDCSPTGSAPYFQLLREWLRECDQNHICGKRKPYWPTRVIFVGGPGTKTLKLRRQPYRPEQINRPDYIALSHCWGTLTDKEKEQFCTTKDNYPLRSEGFSFDDLPKTFQDAVEVTQQLGKEYLWIDSICITQNDSKDWENEAGLMEDIFASAYCTIAASRATSCKDGFLKGKPRSQYVQIQDIKGRRVNVCDFDKDVNEGPLNKRAWVLQERVLSRRTIHISAEQTYWECGEGVRCDNFTRLEYPPGNQYFVIDPNFPKRLTASGDDRTIEFVQFFFKKYSRCGLSYESDRSTAISGLVKRIEGALKTEARYGVFGCFLSRLLLWKRSNEKKTAPIIYPGGKEPPSWSWMAYYGGIDFISTPRFEVPNFEGLRFDTDKEAIISKIRQFKNCRLEQQEKEHAIFADQERVGSLWFDMAADIESKSIHCVIIGMRDDAKEDPKKTYYILVVRGNQQKNGYERLGVGEVEALYVSMESDTGKLL